uniref:Transmembrane protein 242 n=1 Tax=Heterosigma akashiwo TaxID=2829 RepID=A0A6V1MHV1_HETAK
MTYLKAFFAQHIYAISATAGVATVVGAGFAYGFRKKMNEISDKEALKEAQKAQARRQKIIQTAYQTHQIGKKIPKPPDLDFSPTALAFKALGYGTVLCLSTFSLAIVGIAYAMDVSSTEEFGAKMKVIGPRKMDQYFGLKPNKELHKDMEEIEGMDIDEEMEFWSKRYFSDDDERNEENDEQHIRQQNNSQTEKKE